MKPMYVIYNYINNQNKFKVTQTLDIYINNIFLKNLLLEN